MREIASVWSGIPEEDLPEDPVWGLTNWGVQEGDYDRIHRFAVTQHRLFETIKPIPGAPQALRRLSNEGVRIRIITHRLYIPYFHETAVAQTVRWLDHHGIPYWDLCFMTRKEAVGADFYIEDSPKNIAALREDGQDVLILSNATNLDTPDDPGGRANDWVEAEAAIRGRYYSWLESHGLEVPAAPGVTPAWAKED